MNEYQWYHDSLPAAKPAEYKGAKKKMPSWLITLIVSVIVSSVLLAAFAIFVMPLIKTPTTIHYSNNTAVPSEDFKSESISSLAKHGADCTVYVSSSGMAGGFFNQQVSLGDGSGVIISEDGYIITSSSVVNSGTEIKVTLNDGQEIPAMVVGNDQKTDIAILKIDADGLVPAALGNSQLLKVGDPVMAVGNPLGPKIMNTVTYGIISGINNNVSLQKGITMNFLQTDANIGAGNAGGALFNTNGDVVGIVIANIQTDGGIALSVPINDVKPLLSSFIGAEHESGSGSDTPMLGITASEEKYGVVVETVSENYPAAKAGIKVGDIIMKIDGTPVTTVAKINEIRMTHQRGETLIATIYRDGETTDIQIVLE